MHFPQTFEFRQNTALHFLEINFEVFKNAVISKLTFSSLLHFEDILT